MHCPHWHVPLGAAHAASHGNGEHEQSGPVQPPWQTHSPQSHAPWPLQTTPFTAGHASLALQRHPLSGVYPSSHSHVPHCGPPVTHRPSPFSALHVVSHALLHSHAAPDQPASHWHCAPHTLCGSGTHFPRPLQTVPLYAGHVVSAGHSHAGPVQAASHRHCPHSHAPLSLPPHTLPSLATAHKASPVWPAIQGAISVYVYTYELFAWRIHSHAGPVALKQEHTPHKHDPRPEHCSPLPSAGHSALSVAAVPACTQ